MQPCKSCIVVRSHRCVWQLEWAELWQYRDLLMLMVKRDFAAKYRQTVLGPLWFMLQPLLMTGVFTIIFSHIARISTHGIHLLCFIYAG